MKTKTPLDSIRLYPPLSVAKKVFEVFPMFLLAFEILPGNMRVEGLCLVRWECFSRKSKTPGLQKPRGQNIFYKRIGDGNGDVLLPVTHSP